MVETQGNYFINCDSEKCMSCKSCLLACAQAHSQELFAPRNALIQKNGKIKAVQCRQCEEAACLSACKINAIRQENGMVKINEDKCIGCKACAKACPYNAISMINKHQRPVALKCDLCSDQATQACVSACPTKALSLSQRYFKRVTKRENLKSILEG